MQGHAPVDVLLAETTSLPLQPPAMPNPLDRGYCARNLDAILTVIDTLTQRWSRLPQCGTAKRFAVDLTCPALLEYKSHCEQILNVCFWIDAL